MSAWWEASGTGLRMPSGEGKQLRRVSPRATPDLQEHPHDQLVSATRAELELTGTTTDGERAVTARVVATRLP